MFEPSIRQLSSALSEEERRLIFHGAKFVRYEPGEVIIEADTTAGALFHIREGAVKIERVHADGRMLIAGFLFEGDFVGLCIADQYPFSARALDATALCRFDRRTVQEAGRRFPGLERRMLATASNEFRQCQDHLDVIMGGSVESKLGRFLLMIGERTGVSDACGRVVSLPMRREEIADYLGHSLESTSRAFSRLREAGTIKTPHRSSVVIVDEFKLAQIAGRHGAT